MPRSQDSRERLGTVVQSARSLSVLLDDILDLSAIDADTTIAGNQAFTIVGAPTGTPGELWFVYDSSGGGIDVNKAMSGGTSGKIVTAEDRERAKLGPNTYDPYAMSNSQPDVASALSPGDA